MFGSVFFGFFTLISSLFIRVSSSDAGGWEGEYYAEYGFPFIVADRSYDMWTSFSNQFDIVYFGIVLNVIFTGLLAMGVTAAILLAAQNRE